jgi:hypothetical protein
MTGEEMERAIAFILEQQAQFAATQQRREETLLNHEETLRDHEGMIRDHAGVIRDHAGVMRDHAGVMRRVEAAQEQTALQVQHLSGAMIELAEAHTRTENTLAATDEKLNALIDTVERHVSEGRNGKA